MRPVTFAVHLEGEAVDLGGGHFWVESRAPVEGGEPLAGIAEIGSGGALCRRELELWADGSLVQTGELSFGAQDAVTFRARGAFGASPDGRRHGTAVLEVTGGRGCLAGACGYVTSNFLLSDTGELTDHHLGLIFLERARRKEQP